MDSIKIKDTEYTRRGKVITWYFKGKEEGHARYPTEQEAIEVMGDLS